MSVINSRVEDFKSRQVVGSVAKKVQECVARVGLHFRNGLIPFHFRDYETTVGQLQNKRLVRKLSLVFL